MNTTTLTVTLDDRVLIALMVEAQVQGIPLDAALQEAIQLFCFLRQKVREGNEILAVKLDAGTSVGVMHPVH